VLRCPAPITVSYRARVGLLGSAGREEIMDMSEFQVVFADGTEERKNVEDKIVLETYGIRFLGATSDLIVPWHRIKEIRQLPGSD
jgi:uncharacterized protein (UPF0248 family)